LNIFLIQRGISQTLVQQINDKYNTLDSINYEKDIVSSFIKIKKEIIID